MRTPETAAYYDVINTQTDDIDFYVALAQKNGGPICEMGAGTGRIALPIARAGVSVTGVDLSEPMLERFRQQLTSEPEAVQQRVAVAQGDMRDWGEKDQFQQVFIPFRVFLANSTKEDRDATLKNCHRILRPGGLLALNVFHPSHAYMRDYVRPGTWHDLATYTLPDGGSVLWSQTSTFDTLNKLVHAEFRYIEKSADGCTKITNEDLTLGYVYRDELLLHLELAGFAVEQLDGGFDGRPLDGEGCEMVVVARRI